MADSFELGHIADAQRAFVIDQAAVDADFAVRGLQHAQNELEQRSLPCAAWTYQRGELAWVQVHEYALQDGIGPVVKRDILQFDEWLHMYKKNSAAATGLRLMSKGLVPCV